MRILQKTFVQPRNLGLWKGKAYSFTFHTHSPQGQVSLSQNHHRDGQGRGWLREKAGHVTCHAWKSAPVGAGFDGSET